METTSLFTRLSSLSNYNPIIKEILSEIIINSSKQRLRLQKTIQL